MPAAVPGTRIGLPMSGVLLGGRRGGAWIGAAAALSAMLSLVAQLVFERALGPEGFALWAYLNSLCVLWLPIACLGSNHLLLSEHYAGRAANRAAAIRLLLLYGSTTLAACAGFVGLGVAGALATSWATGLTLALLFLAQVPVVLVYPLLQARGRADWVALWPLVQILLRLAVALLALGVGLHFESVMAAWALGCVALGGLAVAWIWDSARSRLRRAGHGATQGWRALAVSAAGFGASDLMDALDLKLLVPLGAWWLSRAETAAAGLLVVLLSAAFFVPHVLVSRLLLPAVHRLGGGSADLRALVRRLCAWSAAALAPIAALWWWLGPSLLARLTRGGYQEQADAIALAGVATMPLVLSMLGGAMHLGRERTMTLLRWRGEALLLFLVAAAWWQAAGLAGLVWAFVVGRAWLCLRVLRPVLSTPPHAAEAP
jgi:O-antigen/teichoic acid export membrane protein